MQILINRIGLVTRDQRKINKLRWGVAGVLLLLNISVYVIWIPARLQISSTFIHINDVWDRIEKALFAVIDLGLSSYFAYLVREKLIANGLTKYNRLFRYNIIMIAFSLALDVRNIIPTWRSHSLTNDRSFSLSSCHLETVLFISYSTLLCIF